MKRQGVAAGAALAALTAAAAALFVGSHPVSAQSPSPSGGSQSTPAAPASSGPTLDPDAPWPTMRHDRRNTGVSNIVGRNNGAQPWSFDTGRGIFATPAISSDGLVFVGSAARTLYGLDAKTGANVWSFATGGIIDTTPALLAPESGVGPTLTIGSGDGHIYKLSSSPGAPRNQKPIWTFSPTLPPAGGQVPWWEGSPNVAPDGTIYQGNTGGAAYAINPDGTAKWAHETGFSVWTPPAMDEAGVTYWGSLSTRVFALNPDGSQKWQRTTLGYVTSAPALDSGGRLFAGSFDGKVYALDSANGSPVWSFPTGDHIYSSPAIVGEGTANEAIVIGSTDGSVYCIGRDGGLKWQFDTGAPVRSSPAVGFAPDGVSQVAYLGSSNGVLYALNVSDGSLRWAFDTTSADPQMANRNELNGSPAVGPEGVYQGTQDGTVWYVPYDYCIAQPGAARCRAAAATKLPDNGMYVFPSTAGGNLVLDGSPGRISPAGIMIGRLMQRQAGTTVPARLVSVPDPASLVTITPHVDADVTVSGDGKYVYVRPKEMLPANTEYTVTVAGVAATGGARIANLDLAPGDLEAYSAQFRVRTTGDGVGWNPTATADAVSGVTFSRLAVPYPPLMTSVNQIGFDFYDWLGGAVPMANGPPVIWLIGAHQDGDQPPVADPTDQPFSMPLYGPTRGGTFSWTAGPQTLALEFATLPFQRFDFRGTFGAGGVIEADSQVFGQVTCADIPVYGSQIPLTGICDPAGDLTFSGTFTGEVTQSPALQRVPGLTVGTPTFKAPTTKDAGSVSVPVTLAPGTAYPASEHFVCVMLADEATGTPVIVDYHGLTKLATDANGNVASTTLTIPAGTVLPERTEAIVMTDAFPAARSLVTGATP